MTRISRRGAVMSHSSAAVATVPGTPTAVTAVGGNAQAAVTWTPPVSDGGSAIIDYTATSSPGGLTGTVAGAAATGVTVSGLTNETVAYTFTVKARNAVGSSVASYNTNSLFPAVTLNGQTLPGRQVWAHNIPAGLPNWSQGGDGLNQWGELYPLDLVDGDFSTPHRAMDGVPRAQQAGLTGIEVLQGTGQVGSWVVDTWMAQADPTWSDSDPNNNFSVAQCIGIDADEDAAVRLITEYAAAAAGHPSAVRVSGKLVTYIYGAQVMSPAGWGRVRSRLTAAGLQYYLIGDLGQDAAARPYSQRAAPIVAQFPYFEASYVFDWNPPGSFWTDLITFLNSNSRQYAGGMMPGYDRETFQPPIFFDAQGTKVFRQQLEENLTSGENWSMIATWNDMVERTEIQATSTWNATRPDVSAFYAAKFRSIPFPRPSAQLYITTPTYIRLGDAPQAEGLVLNGSNVPVTVTTQLIDSGGASLGAAQITTVAPFAADDATTPGSTVISVTPNGHYLRATATMKDMSGTVLQTVTSAPILVYGVSDNPTPQLTRLYYSIPAYAALPGLVTFSLSGDPTTGTVLATSTAPGGVTVRFNEVLQNTRQVWNGFASSGFVATVPMTPRTIIGGQVISAAANGFYLSRVIDEQERVGYSNPVYVA